MGSTESTAKPPSAALKQRPISFVVLGMLRLGARSGYAVKKATDVSTRFFWPTSLAQVYPELAKLERAGLVTRHDDSHGNRRRSRYEISEDGTVALRRWLRSTRESPPQFRDEGILRLYFADALPAGDQRVLVRRLRDRAGRLAAEWRDDIVPLALALEQATGLRYPAVVARLGADTAAFVAERLSELEEELDS